MRPYACLYTDSSGIRRKTKFDSEEEFQAYVTEMTKNSSTYVIPDQEIGRLFSLVTCSYEFDDARTILYCYEIEK